MKFMTDRFMMFTVLFLVTIYQFDTKAQCGTVNYNEVCIPELSPGFNFLKTYKINGEMGTREKVEYSYIFTKGTQYMINICSGGTNTDGIVLTLFDEKRNRIASNKIGNDFFKAIIFPCNATGIFYIQYTFIESRSQCGGSALGFKR